MKRVGLLGGTFDPPHKGHFSIAKAAVNSLQLDEVWFIPTYEPPHKTEASTDSEHRLQMLRLMIAKERNFYIKTIELKRKGKSYTIDTMNELLIMYPNVQFYFIIGADMVEYLPNWHKIDNLIQLVHFVGVKRRGYKLSSRYPIIDLEIPVIEISSTLLRQRLKNKKSIAYLTPVPVYSYIKEKRLYG